MSFKELKKRSTEQLEDLKKKLLKETQKESDPRFWKPTKDKSGNGYALIRFLPAADGESEPYVKYMQHWFEGQTKKQYIKYCPTMWGKECPVCEANSVLWNTGTNANKEIARKRSRKKNFVSNIYVINDPLNPENNGKVFLFRYGDQIFQKIKEKISPEFEQEQSIDVFNFWEGANFKLKIRKKDGGKWDNYESSEFESPSEFLNGDEKALEAVYNQLMLLAEFADSSKHEESYADLQKRFNEVVGGNIRSSPEDTDEQTAEEVEEVEETTEEESDEEEIETKTSKQLFEEILKKKK